MRMSSLRMMAMRATILGLPCLQILLSEIVSGLHGGAREQEAGNSFATDLGTMPVPGAKGLRFLFYPATRPCNRNSKSYPHIHTGK